MTRTVADASRDYRKRKADKIARYEAALREIEQMGDKFPETEWHVGYNAASEEAGRIAWLALAGALNQEMGRGL